jgi:tetratricopeptide (TPR) repeat protein
LATAGAVERRRRLAEIVARYAGILGAVLVLSALLIASAAAQPEEASVFVARASIAYEEKRYDDALAALREALQLDPNNVDALYYTGLVNIALRRFNDATPALEKARGLEPHDQAILFQLGALYFGQAKYDQAQPLLEEAFGQNPRQESLGYYVGFMRYRKKDYQGALRAFRVGTSADPNIQQLTRFYSGLAFAVLGLEAQAASEINESLKLQPASPLTGPAERLLGVVTAAREKERRFHAEVRLGGYYDDNVPVSPAPNSRDPLVVALRQREQTSFGELASLRGDYSFFRQGGFDATATASFYATYNNDLPKFNILDALGGIGTTYRNVVNGVPYQGGLQYTYDYLTLGGHEFVQRHTVVPSAVVALNSWNLDALQLRYQSKQFAQDRGLPHDEKRSATNYLIGLTHVFRFADDKHLIKVGYQFDWDDTEGKDYAYRGNRVLAGAQYTLPWWRLRANYDFDVHLRNYEHVNAVLPVQAPNTVRRSDTEYTHVVGLTLPLPYNLALTANYQASRSHSNIAVFTYDRNVATLILSWTY